MGKYIFYVIWIIVMFFGAFFPKDKLDPSVVYIIGFIIGNVSLIIFKIADKYKSFRET